MILETQDDIIRMLSSPGTYGRHVRAVEVRQSHIALLFLTDEKVYKLKRAVLYPEADFSTFEKRRLACVHEMKRSAIYAPRLIQGIKSVRRFPNGRLVIGGKGGEEIDTVLEMKRIPDKTLLNRLLPSSRFGRFETMDLAERIADFHKHTKVFKNKWGVDAAKKIILENEAILSCFCPDIFDRRQLDFLTRSSLQALSRQARLIAFRQKTGAVRKCHGDLLLSNIAYDKNEFLFFSPIEYNDTLSCIDTLYDLAYLLMDLEAKNLRSLSNILFNHYMAQTNDIVGFPLLSLYQSMRAAARAAVCAKKATLLEGAEKRKIMQDAIGYFKLAQHFMSDFSPVLIACGGLSGSGKSLIAREMGCLMNPAPGAVILQDFIVRQQIAGKNAHSLEKACPAPAFDKVVYDILYRQAQTALEVRSSVIIVAGFYTPSERQAVEKLAAKAGVPFIGLWMDAPMPIRIRRVQEHMKKARETRKSCEWESHLSLETGAISWRQVLTDTPPRETVSRVLRYLQKQLKKHKIRGLLK